MICSFHTRRFAPFTRDGFNRAVTPSHGAQCQFALALDMERSRVIALCVLNRRRRRRQSKRSCWVHPINKKRDELSSFHTLFTELREDESKFLNYFRMSISSFDELNRCLKEVLQRQDTNMRDCIKPEEMLAITRRRKETTKIVPCESSHRMLYTTDARARDDDRVL